MVARVRCRGRGDLPALHRMVLRRPGPHGSDTEHEPSGRLGDGDGRILVHGHAGEAHTYPQHRAERQRDGGEVHLYMGQHGQTASDAAFA